MGTSYFYQILTRVVKSNRHDWKCQKYETGVIKEASKKDRNWVAGTLTVLEKKCVTKILGMHETRTNILAVSCKEI